MLGLHKEKFAGRRTLVVGSGMSAATALASLSQLAGDAPGTNILYVTRASGLPFSIIEGDVLPQRSALSALGNRAASGDIACKSARWLACPFALTPAIAQASPSSAEAAYRLFNFQKRAFFALK